MLNMTFDLLQSRDIQCSHELVDGRPNVGESKYRHHPCGQQERPGGRAGSYIS